MLRTHILKGFSDVESALWVHKYYPGLNIKQMVKIALDNGYTVTDTVNYEIAQLLCEWGLADKKSRTLTPVGGVFYSVWETKRSVAIDILHGMQYSLWTAKSSEENIASWAYKIICDYLWERQELPRSDQLVTYINDLRSEQRDTTISHIGNAFSSKSINDAYDWLLPLEPPVLDGVSVGSQARSFRSATFRRRQFCSTALFVMGLAYIARESGSDFGDLIRIDDDRKKAICSYCLIEETSFDMMLDDALRKVPFISLQKEWDTYFIMDREPEIADFLE